MRARAILLIVVAFLLGAIAAGSIGVRVIREVRTDDDATSAPVQTTTSTVAQTTTYQLDPSETLIASTALLPIGVETTASELAVSYELASLAPRSGVEPITFVGGFGVVTVIENEDLDHVYPRTWVVESDVGTFEGGPANPNARVARFDVDDGFSVASIESITITEALAPYPIEVPFTLSEAEPRAEVIPGVVMELLNVSEGRSTIVQVGIEVEDPNVLGFFVTGDGPGWRSAFFEAEGRPRVNLTWVGGDLPSDIPLVATGTVGVPVEGPFDVSLEGLL